MVTGNSDLKVLLSKKDTLEQIENNTSLERFFFVENDILNIAVLDIKNKKWLSFESFLFNELSELESILQKQIEENSQLTFTKNTAIVNCHKGILIPNALYDESEKRAYLKLNFDFQDADFYINAQALKNSEAYFIGLLEKKLEKVISDNLPNTKIVFHATTWIDFIPVYLRNIKYKESVFINFSGNNIDITVFEDAKLSFHNSFFVKNEIDVLFHVLNVVENKSLNKEKIHLFLSGRISPESEKMQQLKRYFSFCKLIKPEGNYKFQHLLSESESRELFILLNHLLIN